MIAEINVFSVSDEMLRVMGLTGRRLLWSERLELRYVINWSCDLSQEPAAAAAAAATDTKTLVCTFCRTNDPREHVYTGHTVKDSRGRVTCPVLRNYTCPLCGATGDRAHTVRYCSQGRDVVTDVKKLKFTDRNACKSRLVAVTLN